MFKRKSTFSLYGLLAFIIVFLFSKPIAAQSIPGIYGGAPLSELGTYRYVELEGASGETYTYPLNGILNYVAYYSPSYNTSGGYLPGGEYSIYYLNAAKAIVGSAGTITYSPNSTETNGVEVSAPNPGATGALGIQGSVLTSSSAPTVVTLSGNGISARVTANGDGFFSFYYYASSGNVAGFVPPGTYTLSALLTVPCPTTGTGGGSGPQPGTYAGSTTVTYSPTSITNPANSGYYVTDAAVTANISLERIGRIPICVYPGS